ncbi:MAG: hypothetical protein NPIRA02_36800 [Nitrospirales bacterium]|nr:MAG: hypothetical protein NPIRA02_36800 [Nitrospirales bacterium]
MDADHPNADGYNTDYFIKYDSLSNRVASSKGGSVWQNIQGQFAAYVDGKG